MGSFGERFSAKGGDPSGTSSPGARVVDSVPERRLAADHPFPRSAEKKGLQREEAPARGEAPAVLRSGRERGRAINWTANTPDCREACLFQKRGIGALL